MIDHVQADVDISMPFRGSDAVRAGTLTWGALSGPRFRRLDADTYVAASVADDGLLRIRAAAVRAGPSAVVTGWSACRVFGLDVERETRPVEISVPDRRVRSAGPTVVRRQRFAGDEVTRCAGLPVTTPVRTAFDLATRAGSVPPLVDCGFDPLTDAVVAADALGRLGAFTSADLVDFARGHRGVRGVRRVPVVASLFDPRSDSPPETRTRVKLVLAGLPRPAVRLELRDAIGHLVYELDLAWPEYRVAVEYDGRDHTRGDRRWRDVDRLDALRREDWLIITVTAHQLARPTWVTDRAGEALLDRGWVPSSESEWARIMIHRRFRS